MPDLSPERWHQVDALLDQALELPQEEQEAFLIQACGDDKELLSEVQALLQSEKEAAHILGESATQYAAPMLPDLQDEFKDKEPPGQEHIGPYRLVQELGRGGMGVVYLAQRDDEHFHHTVAIKVIQRGLTSQALLSRFHYEREILATLEHPNIARLYDGGTTDDGRPYFVMEYVEGLPVTDYCDEHRLSIQQRLALFRTVCRAVQYAHQNLIVHRDLKPSNILVTDDGQVKLLDFGIAKLLSEEATDEDVPQTQTGQRLMTPEYAAPEQIRGEVITTATDVYQLGVLLYELLTGRRPFRMESRVRYEIERVILEEEPTRPSTAIGQTEEIVEGKTISPEIIGQARSTSVDNLERRLRGDLDVIVLKALRKEQDRRYGSAEQLSEDVRRHLAGLPVEAQTDSTGYRLSKFVQRHKAGVSMAIAFVVVLAGASIMLALQQATTAEERDRATLERDKAQEVAKFMENLFVAADPFAAQPMQMDTLRIRDFLDLSVEKVEKDLAPQPDMHAQMLNVLANVYKNLGLFDQAISLGEQALDVRTDLYGPRHLDVAESQHTLGALNWRNGNLDEAHRLIEAALETRRDLLGEEHALVAKNMGDLSTVLENKGEYEMAEAYLRHALHVKRALLGTDEHNDIARLLNNLAVFSLNQNDYEQAEHHFREALDIWRKIHGEQHADVADGLNNVGVVLIYQGKYREAADALQEALEIKRTVLGNEHPLIATALHNIGFVLEEEGDLDQAEQYYREALALRRKVLDKEHVKTALTLYNLGNVLWKKKEFAQAETVFTETLAMFTNLLGDAHIDVLDTRYALGALHYDQGNYTLSETMLSETLEIGRRELPPDHRLFPYLLSSYGACLTALERYDAAESMLLEGHQLAPNVWEKNESEMQELLERLVALYEAWGKPDKVTQYQALLAQESDAAT